MKTEISISLTSNATNEKLDLQELSIVKKEGGSLTICDLPSSSTHQRNHKYTSSDHFSRFLHQCKYCHLRPHHDCCSVDEVASAGGDESMRVSARQCRHGKLLISGGLCTVNRQPWGEIEWLPGLPADETALKEKQYSSHLQQPSPDFHNRLILPPKKRIRMSMGHLTAAESQHQILDFSPEEEEACMPSVHERTNFQGESLQPLKPLAKSPKWLQRRYKLLSEIA